MKVDIESKRQEALRRMTKLGIAAQAIDQFKNSGLINISEPPLGALVLANDEDLEHIHAFEAKQYDLVYTVIRTYSDIGMMDAYLFVSDYMEDWDFENEVLDNGEVSAYVYNHSNPDMSEIGSIGVKCTDACIVRTW